MDQERLFPSNESYQEGRQTELIILRTLEKAGLIVTGTKGNQKHYDIVIIDPSSDKEFVAQIKSSKTHTPYIRCYSLQGLLETAQQMKCIPLIILSFTISRKFVIIQAITNEILYSTHEDYVTNSISDFKCWNKEK